MAMGVEPYLVRGADRRESANFFSYPTVWLRPVLFARRRPKQCGHYRNLRRRCAVYSAATAVAGNAAGLADAGDLAAANDLRLAA